MNKFIFLCFLFLVTSCSSQYGLKTHPVAFGPYSHSSSLDRAPASVENPLNFSLLKDFVLLDDYGKQVHYRLETRFWTNKDRQYLGKKLQNVVQKTMHDVLTDLKQAEKIADEGGEKVSMVASLKGHVIGHLINEFVKTLYFYKVTSGTFQFDISIVPIQDSHELFTNELSSNQLLQLPSESRMSDYIEEKVQGMPQRIVAVSFPNKYDNQFLGGNISIAFKLLDFDINPLRPIPNPKKNAVKGQIIYRKYFRKNSREVQHTSGENVVVKELNIKEGKSQFMTADYVYNFNLGSLIPKINKVEFTLGALEGRGHYKTGFFSHIKAIFEKKEKSITGKKWKAEGSISENGQKASFSMGIRKITYFPINKKYSLSGYLSSSLRSHLDDGPSTDQGIDIVEREGGVLVEALGISSFVNPVIEGEN